MELSFWPNEKVSTIIINAKSTAVCYCASPDKGIIEFPDLKKEVI
jgi:hypothetical protein